MQYAALADFSYVWLRRLMPDVPYFAATSTRTDCDAVGGGTVDLAEFARRLSGVFRAAARALKPGGPFCFTYHHNDLDSYTSLVVACLDAGLIPMRTIGCPSEMRGSIHMRSCRGFASFWATAFTRDLSGGS